MLEECLCMECMGAYGEQRQMPTCCSMSCCWAVGRQKDVRVIGDSLVSSSTVLSSTSKSPVVSASSSAKLAESHRNVIFKAIAQTARWEARRLWLQHYQNYYTAITGRSKYICICVIFFSSRASSWVLLKSFLKKNEKF